MADDDTERERLERQAARAETWSRLAGAETHIAALQAQGDERAKAVDRRLEDLRQAIRDHRAEARDEHEAQTAQLALNRRELEHTMALNRRELEEAASARHNEAMRAIAQLRNDDRTDRIERDKLSTTRLVAYVGAAITLGSAVIGVIGSIVLKLLGGG